MDLPTWVFLIGVVAPTVIIIWGALIGFGVVIYRELRK
jgi:hypothetical protein